MREAGPQLHQSTCGCCINRRAAAVSIGLSIISFILSFTCVDRQVERKMKGICKRMLFFLHTTDRDGWHYLVTHDESRFFMRTSLRRPCIRARDDMITKRRADIQNKKFMFTVMWILHGFYIVYKLQNDIKINSEDFVTDKGNRLRQTSFP
jgi:hypothetical protein